MFPPLTEGSLVRLMNGASIDISSQPVMQVLGARRVMNQQQERYRLLISDGRNSYHFAMLSTQLNHLVSEGKLDTFTIIKVKNTVCNTVPAAAGREAKKLLIILDLEVLCSGSEVGEKLGDPQALNDVGEPPKSSNTSPAATTTATTANRSVPARQEAPPPSRPAITAQNNASLNKTSGGEAPIVHPIQSLTPYQNRWTIKARVSKKGDIKTWSNSRGEGKLFSIDLMDESGEIRATAFNQEAEKFYDMIEEGKVYYISGASLKAANKQYSSINNDYEMSFNSRTQVTQCFDDTSSIPNVSFNFVPISSISEVDKDAVIDVIGVAKSASDLSTIVSKNNNKEYKKREVHLVDTSKTEVSLTLWGREAEDFNADMNPVVALKGVKVSDFGGKSLSAMNSTRMLLNPDLSEAHKLRGWYDNEGASIQAQSISAGRSTTAAPAAWKTFAEAKAEGLGGGEKPDYYTVKAMVAMIQKEKALYMACPQQECNKKIIDQNNGLYRCEKCNREYDSYKWRLMLSINLTDFTDHQWVTLFHESAEVLLGKSAQELGELKESDGPAFQRAFESINFKWFLFRLRVKMETYNDESRLKTIVFEVKDLDYADYNRRMLAKLRELQL